MEVKLVAVVVCFGQSLPGRLPFPLSLSDSLSSPSVSLCVFFALARLPARSGPSSIPSASRLLLQPIRPPP